MRKACWCPECCKPIRIFMSLQHAAGHAAGSLLVHAGFRELCQRDARFEPFSSTLFGPAAVDLDRDAKGPEANWKLDASVALFLGLLADHLMLPAAMQALEFLVRRLK